MKGRMRISFNVTAKCDLTSSGNVHISSKTFIVHVTFVWHNSHSTWLSSFHDFVHEPLQPTCLVSEPFESCILLWLAYPKD